MRKCVRDVTIGISNKMIDVITHRHESNLVNHDDDLLKRVYYDSIISSQVLFFSIDCR